MDPPLRPLNPPRIDRFSLWPRIYDARIPYRGLLPCVCLWIIESSEIFPWAELCACTDIGVVILELRGLHQ
jgi:hypothetical protein